MMSEFWQFDVAAAVANIEGSYANSAKTAKTSKDWRLRNASSLLKAANFTFEKTDLADFSKNKAGKDEGTTSLLAGLATLAGQANCVDHWFERVKRCNCIDELNRTMQEFGRLHWSLLDRAAMSSVYTPLLLTLIETESLPKWHTLQDIATLCWNYQSDKVTTNQTLREGNL